MTNLWNTLWGFWDAGKVDPFALETCFPDFIKKIRAEGDRLKAKAEMTTVAFRTRDAAITRTLKAEDKLEVIKTWAESEYTKFTKDDLWKLGPPNYGTKRTLEKLMKILEGENLQNIGETQA